MKKLQDLQEEFNNYPTKKNEYEIDDKKYIVVSHFVGNKDIDKVLEQLATLEAYRTQT